MLMSQLPELEPRDAYALWAPHYPAHAHNPVMLAEERAMLSMFPESLLGKRVLDAGCGSGRYLLHALRRGATTLAGVDISSEMIQSARMELAAWRHDACIALAQGSLTTLPMPGEWADLTLCALAVGHVDRLEDALFALREVTRPGGTLLCSDVHPIGAGLGWQRDFRSGGRRYAVKHAIHTVEAWHDTCARVGLTIETMAEPALDPADVPMGAHFDPRALSVPVVLAFRLRRPG